MTIAPTRFDAVVLPPNIRALMRVDDDCLVRKIDRVCGELMHGDFLRAYIWVTLQVLNVRRVTHSEATFEYADFFAFPPDAKRDPISANAFAKVIHLPYETVRRQCIALEADGLCERIDGKGFRVPVRVFQEPRIMEAAKHVFQIVQRSMIDLHRAGYDFSAIARSPRSGVSDPVAVARAVIRLDADYSMDVIDILRVPHHNDPIEAMIFAAIARENTRHIGSDAYAGLDDLVPDEARRPVSILAASTSLKIPYETLRRAIHRMIGEGRLVRVKKEGVIAPANVQRELENAAALKQRYLRFTRFIADLQYLGFPMPQ